MSANADAHRVLEMGQEEEETELVIEDETAIFDSGNSNASVNGNSSPEDTGTGKVSRARLVNLLYLRSQPWLKFIVKYISLSLSARGPASYLPISIIQKL